MTSCRHAAKYKGVRPPKCNAGDPCDRCLAIWEASPSNPANAAWRERMERRDGPMHTHFGLSYASYLVLRRTFMQGMPVAWQEKMVALLDELDETYDVPIGMSSFDVQQVRESYEFEVCENGCEDDPDDEDALCECDLGEVPVRTHIDDPYSDYRRPPPLPYASGYEPK